MSDYYVAPTANRFEIGRVINQTFGVIGRNAVSIFIVCFALTLTGVLLGALVHYVAAGLTSEWQTGVNSIVGSIVNFATHAVLLGCVTAIAVNDLNDRRAPFSWAFSVGLRLILPVLGINLITAFGICFAMILFIVPGLMLLTWWIVAVPVRVVEGPGVIKALARSRELSKGRRWPIFGLVVCYAVLAGVFTFGFMVADGGYAEYAVRLATYDPLTMVIQVISSTILAAISTSGVAAIYTELRRTKEGALPGQLASVFD